MRHASRTRPTFTAVAIALAVVAGWAAGVRAAPVAVAGGTAGAMAPVVQPAAHRLKAWQWHGGWWRDGPWADHVIQGIVVTRPWQGAVFVPWGAERPAYCGTRYRPATGTHLSRAGKRRICR